MDGPRSDGRQPQLRALLKTIIFIAEQFADLPIALFRLAFEVFIPLVKDKYINMGAGKEFVPASDIGDLSRKVVLVTGGNAGLGKQTIAYVAAHNPRVYLAARTESKAKAAIAELKKLSPDAQIEYLPLDLASFATIKSAAETFKAREGRLDILINNAGVMATPYSMTLEGYEIQFGTNHMGHFLLTKLLLPILLSTAAEPSADVRIVNLTSMGHFMAPRGGILWDQKSAEGVSTWRRYGGSKLANILFTKQLAEHYPQVTSVSIHPGVILTRLYASVQSNFFLRIGVWFYGLLMPFLPGHYGDTKGGALNQTWAATVPKTELKNGQFYMPVGTESKGSAYAQDEGLAKKLWEWSEGEVAKHGY